MESFGGRSTNQVSPPFASPLRRLFSGHALSSLLAKPTIKKNMVYPGIVGEVKPDQNHVFFLVQGHHIEWPTWNAGFYAWTNRRTEHACSLIARHDYGWVL